MKRIFFIIVFALPFVLSSCGFVGIEQPEYTVLEKDNNYEVRKYDPQIVAKTLVDADFEEAGNIAFRRLFDYISGDNKKQASISMTAPVTQSRVSEKIDMTAPVLQHRAGEKYAVSFILPSKYTLETAPEPVDERIIIQKNPAQRVVAIRYSGTWSQSRYEKNKELLEKFIETKGFSPQGEAVFARYNSPFQLWFLRRNEVLIPVE